MAEDQAFTQVPWQNSPYLNADSLEDYLSGEESPYWRDVQIETLPPDDENIWEDFGEVFSIKPKSQTFTPSVAESPTVLASQFHPGDSPAKSLVTDKLDDGNSVTQPIPTTSANHADGITRPRSHEVVTMTTPLFWVGDCSKRQSPKRRHRRQRARLSKVTTYDLDSLLLAENESELSADINNGQHEEGEREMSTNDLCDGRVCELFDNHQTEWNSAETTIQSKMGRSESQTKADNSATPEEIISLTTSIEGAVGDLELTGSRPSLSPLPKSNSLQDCDSRIESTEEVKEGLSENTPQESPQSPANTTHLHHQTAYDSPQVAEKETVDQLTAAGKDEAIRQRGKLRNIVDILTCLSCTVTPSYS